jgi:hypothetical protein
MSCHPGEVRVGVVLSAGGLSGPPTSVCTSEPGPKIDDFLGRRRSLSTV